MVALLPLLGACGPGELPVAADDDRPAGEIAARGDGLEILGPAANLPPGAGTGAVYLTVVATGDAGDRLLGASTPAARSAMLHESVDEAGVHRMEEHAEGFAVPAGGRLELRPGGKHVMLMGMDDGAIEAGTIPLTLHFERAGAIEVPVPVASPAAPPRP